MKHKLLLSVMLMLMALVACDNRNGDEYPSYIDVLLYPTEDFYFMVEHRHADYQKLDAMYIGLVSKDFCTKVVLNGNTYYQDNYSYWGHSGYYDHEFDFDYNDWDILDNNNGVLSYQIFFPTRTVSGTIQMPSYYQTAYPTFDRYQDWNIAWTLNENPDFQTCDLYLHNSGYNSVSDVAELSGNKRSYVWNKNLWSRLGVIDDLELEMTANNYEHKDGGVIWVMRQNEFNQGAFTAKRPRDPQKRLKQLLSGQIQLTK